MSDLNRNWRWERKGCRVYTDQMHRGRPMKVAEVSITGLDEDGLDARGRLIAAAPCMRNALTEARTTLAMLKRNVVTEIARHDGLLRWEGVPEAIQARIDECDAAITRADGGGA